MMLNSVPRRTGSWRGTGTVMVVPAVRFCMIRWLPRCLTAVNPYCSRIWQISEPERTRSLPNGYLDLGYKHFTLKSPRDFRRGSRFEEESERFNKTRPGFFNRSPLA